MRWRPRVSLVKNLICRRLIGYIVVYVAIRAHEVSEVRECVCLCGCCGKFVGLRVRGIRDPQNPELARDYIDILP